MRLRTHYGQEEGTMYESNEPDFSAWAACHDPYESGPDEGSLISNDPKQVTCKRCLKHLVKNGPTTLKEEK